MKKAGIILGSILGIIALLILGVNLYFTDQRLKEIIIPPVEEAIGTSVTIQTLSLNLLRSFPNIGLELSGLSIADESGEAPLFEVSEVLVGVELLPLLDKEVVFTEIFVFEPTFTYTIDAKGSTNIDFILNKFSSDSPDTSTDTSSTPLNLNIASFRIENGMLGYEDAQTKTSVKVGQFDLTTSLSYNETIDSKIDALISGLMVESEGSSLISNMSVELHQESTFNPELGTLDLRNSTLAILGLQLGVSGKVTQLNDEFPILDLSIESSSKNLSALLDLVPAEYKKELKGVETRGQVAIQGKINGPVGGDDLPQFNLNATIANGYFKYPKLEPIEKIELDAEIDNKQMLIKALEIKAGSNNVSIGGRLFDILTDNITYDMGAKIDVDLSTIERYYSLKPFDIEQLKGKLFIDGSAKGNLNEPEKSQFNLTANLNNGFLKYDYPGVTQPIQNIIVSIQANPKLVTIKSFEAKASSNSIRLSGTINEPLNEKRSYARLKGELNARLETIKQFYPISEDTLKMRGKLTANLRINTRIADLENADAAGKVVLENGYIKHRDIYRPIENIQLSTVVNKRKATVQRLSLSVGSNSLSGKGSVTNYLSDNPLLTLDVKGNVTLGEVKNYVDISEFVQSLNGTASTNLKLKGPIKKLSALAFTGGVDVRNVNIEQKDLPAKIKNLNVNLTFSEKNVQLGNLSMLFGRSDMKINGRLDNYMIFVDPNKKGTSSMSGSFTSSLFDVDEFMDWEEESSNDPVYVDLPNLNSTFEASVKKMIVMDIELTNLTAKSRTTPRLIELQNSSVNLFGGKAEGAFVWKVPRRDRTNMSFNGTLTNVRAEDLLKKFKVGGKKGVLHQHLTGGMNAIVNYQSDLDEFLTPDLKTSKGQGSFGMTKARLQNHPTQVKIADFLKVNELRNIALDEWNAKYVIDAGVLTLSDMKLTSGDIGAELNGTHNLITDKLDFKMSLFLPSRFASAIASVITKDAVDALTRDDNSIYIPLKITGTGASPRVVADQGIIGDIVKEYLKNKVEDKAKGLIKGLFGN